MKIRSSPVMHLQKLWAFATKDLGSQEICLATSVNRIFQTGAPTQRRSRQPILEANFSFGSLKSGCKGKNFITGHILTMNIMGCFSTLYCVWQFLPVNFFCTSTIILGKTCGSNSWWQPYHMKEYKERNIQKRTDFVTFLWNLSPKPRRSNNKYAKS